MCTARRLYTALHLHLILSLVQAYTWKFNNNPTQCGKLSVSIDGSDGQAPFNLLLLPYGASVGQFETRAIQTLTFNSTDGKSLDFVMNYPSGSEFVAVVSDATKFASGGTSAAWTVKGSSDNSCFDSTKVFRPKWPFFYLTTDGLRSCESTTIFWNSSNPNITGTVNFAGVIPNGESFNITSSPLWDIPAKDDGTPQATGFNWTVPVNPGTDLLLVSGDEGATGTGGWVEYRVSPPQDASHTACFPSMPSATGGTPAGGDPSGSLDDDKKTNVYTIAGGVVGAIVLLAVLGLIVFFFLRYRRNKRLDAQSVWSRKGTSNTYSVIPFSASHTGTPSGTGSSYPNNHNRYTSTDYDQTPTGSGFDVNSPLLTPGSAPITSKRRKGGASMPNSGNGANNGGGQISYVHHTDAEDALPSGSNPQVVDLPPAYNPRRAPATSNSGSGSTPDEGEYPMSTISSGSRGTGDRKVRRSDDTEAHSRPRPSGPGESANGGRTTNTPTQRPVQPQQWPYTED